MFHFPCHEAGPMTLEWSAAAYERMAAQRDFWDADREGWSWHDPYVIAAEKAAEDALRTVLGAPCHQRLTYAQRRAL